MTDAKGYTRVDAHHHFWEIQSGSYDWPTQDDGVLYRDYRPTDLEPELRAAGIDRTVVVQTVDTLADTDSMLERARGTSFIAGVVGWLPLHDIDTLDAALDERGDGCLKGVRHRIHRETDPAWLGRSDVEAGLRRIARLGLPFDVVAVWPDHLRLVPVIADRIPELTLVIDHLAKPPFRRDGWDRWSAELRLAAERPNVVAKLSGLDTAAGTGWTVKELAPAVDVALGAFGPDRLMFGSDWPVCCSVSTYHDVVEATDDLVGPLSEHERAAILGGTASRVYRLGPEVAS